MESCLLPLRCFLQILIIKSPLTCLGNAYCCLNPRIQLEQELLHMLQGPNGDGRKLHWGLWFWVFNAFKDASPLRKMHVMNSMKLVISVIFCFNETDSKRCFDTTTPESIHTKDESKRGSAFAFIFGVN